MGNAAAVQSVVESSRRRLLLQQWNRQSKDVLVSNSLLQAFEQRRLQSLQPQRRRAKRPGDVQLANGIKESLQSLRLHEIYDVLTDFGVLLTLEELPAVLRHLGCRQVEASTAAAKLNTGEALYSVLELVGYVAPRRILRQLKRPLERPCSSEYSHNNVTIWQAAKVGDIEVLEAICEGHGDSYRALDDFENSPLYYASLCGREVAVDFVLRAYDKEGRKIPADELLRCVTNALNQHVRALLQQKMTLEDVLRAKKQECEQDGNDDEDKGEGGTWFGLLGGADED